MNLYSFASSASMFCIGMSGRMLLRSCVTHSRSGNIVCVGVHHLTVPEKRYLYSFDRAPSLFVLSPYLPIRTVAKRQIAFHHRLEVISHFKPEVSTPAMASEDKKLSLALFSSTRF